MFEQQDLFNETDNLRKLSRAELKLRFKDLTGFAGDVLENDQLVRLLESGDKDEAIAELTQAEAIENATDRRSNYIIGK